jgi:glutamate/tyrosine decarboxylase-like PLP-dependent enzyme
MLGLRAFREAIGRSLDLAEWGADFIRAEADLEFLAPPSLGILCFRYRPDGVAADDPGLDRLNSRIHERVVESGAAMISSTALGGKFALRLCVLNYRSSVEDVEQVLNAILQAAREERAP